MIFTAMSGVCASVVIAFLLRCKGGGDVPRFVGEAQGTSSGPANLASFFSTLSLFFPTVFEGFNPRDREGCDGQKTGNHPAAGQRYALASRLERF